MLVDVQFGAELEVDEALTLAAITPHVTHPARSPRRVQRSREATRERRPSRHDERTCPSRPVTSAVPSFAKDAEPAFTPVRSGRDDLAR